MAGLHAMSMMARIENVLVSYCRYLGKVFWPAHLCIFYPMKHWTTVTVVAATVLLVGITLVVFALRRRGPFLLVGWLWFLGILVPVIGFVQIGQQAMADYHAYVPSIGLLTAVVWGVCNRSRRWQFPIVTLLLPAFAAFTLGTILTRHQLIYWRDSETVFRHAIEVTGDTAVAHEYIGTALFDKHQVDAAISEYQEAMRLDPAFPEPYYNLGLAFAKKGQNDDAIAQFKKDISLDPGNSDAYYNLGVVLGQEGRNEEAISQYREAVRINPDHVDARYNLGTALGMAGQIDEAIGQFREVIRLQPDHAGAHNNLGNALDYKGQVDAAVSEYQEALRLQPGRASTRNNLAITLEEKGQTNEAVTQLREAVRLEPDYFDARSNLGEALFHQGRLDDAITEFQAAARLRPNDPLTQKKLALLVSIKNGSVKH